MRIHNHAHDRDQSSFQKQVPRRIEPGKHDPQTTTNPHIKVGDLTDAPEKLGPLHKVQPIVEFGKTLLEQPLSVTGTTSLFEPLDGFYIEKVLRNVQTGSLASTTFNEFGQVVAGRENEPYFC